MDAAAITLQVGAVPVVKDGRGVVLIPARYLIINKDHTVAFLADESLHQVRLSSPFKLTSPTMTQGFLSRLCHLFGGHRFIELGREHHYDSSQTAQTACSRCGRRANF